MKQIVATRLVEIPDDIKFEVKARKVRAKGPRGEFSGVFCPGVHLSQPDVQQYSHVFSDVEDIF